MIDYLGLLLINMVAGLVLLALYVYAGLDDPEQKRWAPGFIVSGLIAFLFGAHMVMVWPIPAVYAIAYGETSVLLGILLLGAGVTMALGGQLWTLAIYAFFAGLVSVELGFRFILLHLSNMPMLTGLGFLATGGAGVLAAPGLFWFRKNRLLRTLMALLLLGAAALWALTGYGAYWMHLQIFQHVGIHGVPMK